MFPVRTRLSAGIGRPLFQIENAQSRNRRIAQSLVAFFRRVLAAAHIGQPILGHRARFAGRQHAMLAERKAAGDTLIVPVLIGVGNDPRGPHTYAKADEGIVSYWIASWPLLAFRSLSIRRLMIFGIWTPLAGSALGKHDMVVYRYILKFTISF